MFEHRVLNDPKDLHKECKKQLRVAYLQQEQVNVSFGRSVFEENSF